MKVVSLNTNGLDRSLRYFKKALELLMPRRAMYYILNTFPSLGKIAHDKKQYDQAAKIMLFTRDHPQVTDTIKEVVIDDLAKLKQEAPRLNIQRIQKELAKKGDDQFFRELLDYLSTG